MKCYDLFFILLILKICLENFAIANKASKSRIKLKKSKKQIGNTSYFGQGVMSMN